MLNCKANNSKSSTDLSGVENPDNTCITRNASDIYNSEYEYAMYKNKLPVPMVNNIPISPGIWSDPMGSFLNLNESNK